MAPGPARCQSQAESAGRPAEGPTGQPDKPPHHAGNPSAAGKARQARHRHDASGILDSEIERGKPACRPAGGNHGSVAKKLPECRLVQPGKEVFVEVGWLAGLRQLTWIMAGQAERDPRLCGGVDKELRCKVKRGQDAVQKNNRRPAVATRQMHVGGHDMAVDSEPFATDGRGWLQSGDQLPFNVGMISKTFWDGKSVVVTGGSSGIGREMARAVAAAGAHVGLMARREDALAEVVAEIRRGGGTGESAVCDVTDPTAVARAVTRLETDLGPTAVAIACAGLHRVTWPLDAARSRAVVDANVNGTTNLFAAVLPGMLDRGQGHLCGIASLAALVGLRKNAAYSASKAAVAMLLESLRVDCQPRGIQVTTAYPGYIDTPMITAEERAAGIAVPVSEAATRILLAIERGRAEVWFPRWTAFQARLLRLLPPAVRDTIVRRLPPMEEA